MNRTALINQVKAKIDELSPEDAVLVDVGLTDEKPIDTIIDELLDESAKEVLLSAPIYRLNATVCNNNPIPDIPDEYIYNVDSEVPLDEGEYYSGATARAAVPILVRKVGLVITYYGMDSGNPELSYSQVTEQFIGTTISDWGDNNKWTETITQPPAPIAKSYAGIVNIPTDYLRLAEFKMQEWERPVTQENIAGDAIAKRQSNRWLRAGVAKPVVVLAHRGVNRVLEYYSVVSDHTIERFLYIKSDVAENVPETLQDALCWVCASKVLSIFGNQAAKTAIENAISLLK